MTVAPTQLEAAYRRYVEAFDAMLNHPTPENDQRLDQARREWTHQITVDESQEQLF